MTKGVNDMAEPVLDSQYLVIPMYVAEHEKLSRTSVILYGYISALSFAKGYCFASNAYLSERLGCSMNTLAASLKELVQQGLIETETLVSERKEVLERRIYLRASYTGQYVPPMDGKAAKSSKPEPVRHIHGSMKNVLLTDKQYSDLKALYPTIDGEIESMSLYLSANGKSYKNYYSALLNWMKRREDEKPKKAGKWDGVDY